MSKEGFERNSLFSDSFKANETSMRAMKFRDSRIKGNKAIAAKRKKVYQKTKKLQAATKVRIKS